MVRPSNPRRALRIRGSIKRVRDRPPRRKPGDGQTPASSAPPNPAEITDHRGRACSPRGSRRGEPRRTRRADFLRFHDATPLQKSAPWTALNPSGKPGTALKKPERVQRGRQPPPRESGFRRERNASGMRGRLSFFRQTADAPPQLVGAPRARLENRSNERMSGPWRPPGPTCYSQVNFYLTVLSAAILGQHRTPPRCSLVEKKRRDFRLAQRRSDTASMRKPPSSPRCAHRRSDTVATAPPAGILARRWTGPARSRPVQPSSSGHTELRFTGHRRSRAATLTACR